MSDRQRIDILYTFFRYRLASGWSDSQSQRPWIRGAYESYKPLALSTVRRRLVASWRKNTPLERIVEVQLLHPKGAER